MRRLVFFILISAFRCLGGDVAVVLDVSGTMSGYGPWQEPARRFIASVLSGKPDDSGWTREGDESVERSFSLGASERVHFVRFGSTRTPGFPFFQAEQTISADELNSQFPVNQSDFKDAKTNKSLAIAVGAKLGASQGVARLIVISDFLMDSDLTEEQQQFVNLFESKAKIESPVILSWQKQPRVMVKLLKVTGIPESGSVGGPDSPPLPRLVITGAQVANIPKRVIFGWRLSDAPESPTFGVSVRDPDSGTVVFTRRGIPGTSLVWNDPPTGQYVWSVTAELTGDRKVTSGSAPVTVPGSSPAAAILGFLAIAGLGAGIWWFVRSRSMARAGANNKEIPKWRL